MKKKGIDGDLLGMVILWVVCAATCIAVEEILFGGGEKIVRGIYSSHKRRVKKEIK